MKNLKKMFATPILAGALAFGALSASTTQSHAVAGFLPAVVGFAIGGINGFAGQAQDQRRFKETVQRCARYVVNNRIKVRRGYNCNAWWLRSNYCTRGDVRIEPKYINRLRERNGRILYRIWWVTKGQCVRAKGDCSASALSGHCADDVKWRRNTATNTDIFFRSSERNLARHIWGK